MYKIHSFIQSKCKYCLDGSQLFNQLNWAETWKVNLLCSLINILLDSFHNILQNDMISSHINSKTLYGMELETIRSTLYYYKHCSWPELCYIIKCWWNLVYTIKNITLQSVSFWVWQQNITNMILHVKCGLVVPNDKRQSVLEQNSLSKVTSVKKLYRDRLFF
jgi:hypothetical protein